MKSRILRFDNGHPNIAIFVQGSWEIGENARNIAAANMLEGTKVASPLLYESSRDWQALQQARTMEDWIAAFGDKRYTDEVRELRDVIEYVKQEYEPQEVFLSGSSFGGSLAILVSDLVSRLVLHAPQIFVPRGDGISIYRGFPDTERLLSVMKEFNGKLTVIYGQDDESVSPLDSILVYEAAGTRDKRLVPLPGNHTFTDNPQGYAQEHVNAFR